MTRKSTQRESGNYQGHSWTNASAQDVTETMSEVRSPDKIGDRLPRSVHERAQHRRVRRDAVDAREQRLDPGDVPVLGCEVEGVDPR